MKKGKIINKIKRYLLKKEEIVFAYIYGSFLEYKTYKDIDIGIFVDEEKVKEEHYFFQKMRD